MSIDTLLSTAQTMSEVLGHGIALKANSMALLQGRLNLYLMHIQALSTGKETERLQESLEDDVDAIKFYVAYALKWGGITPSQTELILEAL